MDNERQIAEWIVSELFRNGNGVEADRLLLIKEDQMGMAKVTNAEYLGGLNRTAVIQRVIEAMRREG